MQVVEGPLQELGLSRVVEAHRAGPCAACQPKGCSRLADARQVFGTNDGRQVVPADLRRLLNVRRPAVAAYTRQLANRWPFLVAESPIDPDAAP